jgi:hypothetical protein
MNRSTFFRSAGALMLALAFSGCAAGQAPGAGQPTAQPATAQPATATPAAAPTARPATPAANPTQAPSRPTAPPVVQPTSAPAQTPAFGFSPQSGGPGTRVALDGWNFAPGHPVVVRLGMPSPIGEVLVAATPGPDGKWSASLTMPDRLPSGDLITTRDLQLVVMDEVNVALASAPFQFQPAPGDPIPPREAAAQTVRDLLAAYQRGGDLRALLSADLRARLDAGEPAEQLLGLPAGQLGSFEVGAPLNRPADALFIPAWLVYSGPTVQREFTVVLEQNTWRVAGSSEPVGELPLPTPDPAAQEWRSAVDADINGDGVAEQIVYRTGKAKISTPTGFSDPSIVAVLVAEEVFVKQGATPGGRTLLYLNPRALNAERERLMLMGSADLPPSGFVVVVYGGERYSYYITPVYADGTPYNQSVRVVWSDAQGAYVMG